MTRYVVCDIHNTLLDSRHRQCEEVFFFSLIHNDTVNYPFQRMLKVLQGYGYKLVFFAYCNTRYKTVVQQVLSKAGFKPDEYTLYTDVNDRRVQNAKQLKEYVYDNYLKDEDIHVAFDTDRDSIDFWKSKDVYVMVPTYE